MASGLIDYAGYKDCVFLENANTRIILGPHMGGRVLEYAYKGENVLMLDPRQDGWTYTPGEKRRIGPSGGRFDVGPEHTLPRHPNLWFGAWTAEVTGEYSGKMTSKEYGPCVRLCKIFTDLPLATDQPVDEGLFSFCTKCTNCAAECPGKAISFDDEPSFRVTCPSNNPGIKRWAVNVDKCYNFWMENGSGCSKCIAACPFTQLAMRKQRVS